MHGILDRLSASQSKEKSLHQSLTFEKFATRPGQRTGIFGIFTGSSQAAIPPQPCRSRAKT
ncbi:MAG: hypothetical protein DWH88_05260 [Planctomycetota bacterium]|nr:MAG: hypothetical protein DWH88_05260 [Planctomycetota bacterium]